MLYMPMVKSSNLVGEFPLGPAHTVRMFDNIRSAGSIQYTYLVGVFDNASQDPVYFVASEVNSMAAVMGGGSHCLGLFEGEGHASMGFSDDWGDPRKFFPQAIEIVSEKFKVPLDDNAIESALSWMSSTANRPPEKPWWKFWG